VRRPRFGGRLQFGNPRTRADSDTLVDDRRRPKQPTVAEIELAVAIREKSLRGLLVRMGGQKFAADAVAGAFAFHVCSECEAEHGLRRAQWSCSSATTLTTKERQHGQSKT
jgi:hypothetical protein